jgi:hypothetical protein
MHGPAVLVLVLVHASQVEAASVTLEPLVEEVSCGGEGGGSSSSSSSSYA